VGAANRGAGPGRGPGWQRRGAAADEQFAADREGFHALLQNRQQIRREVKNTERGVETLTESDQPEIAALIRKHVCAMAKRVEEGRPIHLRDPLFAEIFRHTDKIQLKHDDTAKGIRVVETSEDPYVARLIQAHGGVVSLFLKHGFEEVWKNHDVPDAPVGRTAAADSSARTAPTAECP